MSGSEGLHNDMVAERPTEEGGVGTCMGTFDTLGTFPSRRSDVGGRLSFRESSGLGLELGLAPSRVE